MRLHLLVLLLVAASCTRRHLPAPAAPPQQLPSVSVPLRPPAPGTGRLLIEAVDGPSVVSVVTADVPAQSISGWTSGGLAYGTIGSHSVTRPICQSPCVVDLPIGTHQLVATSIGDSEKTARVMVGTQGELQAARVALGRRESRVPSIVAYTAATVLGIFAFAATMTTADLWDDPDESRAEMLGLTIGSSVATVALLGLGYWLRADEQPGAVTQWAIAP